MATVYITWPRGADIKNNICATSGVLESAFAGAPSPPQSVKSMERQSLVDTIPLLLMAHILQR